MDTIVGGMVKSNVNIGGVSIVNNVTTLVGLLVGTKTAKP
jgi:hypothetical protein